MSILSSLKKWVGKSHSKTKFSIPSSPLSLEALAVFAQPSAFSQLIWWKFESKLKVKLWREKLESLQLTWQKKSTRKVASSPFTEGLIPQLQDKFSMEQPDWECTNGFTPITSNKIMAKNQACGLRVVMLFKLGSLVLWLAILPIWRSLECKLISPCLKQRGGITAMSLMLSAGLWKKKGYWHFGEVLLQPLSGLWL